jgi:FixJ family two-component response regulator
MARFLRAAGFDVSEFQSADDFLLHHDIRIPGLRSSDVALGDGNGVDVYCALQEQAIGVPRSSLPAGGMFRQAFER